MSDVQSIAVSSGRDFADKLPLDLRLMPDGLWVYFFPAGDADAERKILDIVKQQRGSAMIAIPRKPDPPLDGYGIERIEPGDGLADYLDQIVNDAVACHGDGDLTIYFVAP